MGIMSVVALGYMQLSANKARQNRTNVVNTQIDSFANDLNGLLHRSGYCQASFEDEYLDEDIEVTVDAIKTPIGNNRYAVNEPYGNSTFRIVKISLSNFELERKNSDNGLAMLSVRLEKLGNIYGAREVSRNYEMIVYRDNRGRITDCAPLSSYSPLSSGRSQQAPNIGVQEIRDVARHMGVDGDITEADLQEALRKNPALRKMQEALNNVQEMNKRLEEDLHKEL